MEISKKLVALAAVIVIGAIVAVAAASSFNWAGSTRVSEPPLRRVSPQWLGNLSGLPFFKWQRGWRAGWRGYAIQVSSEYEDAVVSIVKSDPDASKLLSEGYNITAIRPLVTAVVTGTGDVALQAKQAVVLLKGSSGFAQVLVDLAQGKVLKITVVTVTVKSKT